MQRQLFSAESVVPDFQVPRHRHLHAVPVPAQPLGAELAIAEAVMPDLEPAAARDRAIPRVAHALHVHGAGTLVRDIDGDVLGAVGPGAPLKGDGGPGCGGVSFLRRIWESVGGIPLAAQVMDCLLEPATLQAMSCEVTSVKGLVLGGTRRQVPRP